MSDDPGRDAGDRDAGDSGDEASGDEASADEAGADPAGDDPAGDSDDAVNEVPEAEVAVVSDDEIVDELPEDLNLAEFVGPYTFPNNNRRRIPAAMYIAIGLGCVALFIFLDGESPLVNVGLLAAGVGLVAFGIYGMVAGWTLRVDESDALVTASTQVGFAVGHASAQQVWHGWLSRPTWRILLYSAENPPRRRGIVLVDGVNGEVLEWFREDNPEDWAALDPSRTALSGD